METHRNNIGLLRLIFASLVIVGHAPEMIDGDRHREPLTSIFHTLSLGELSVDAFFVLSGYLIAKSFLSSGSVTYYLERRVLRIYPAFVVAYLITVFLLGPILGAHPLAALATTLARAFFLMDPMQYPGQLQRLAVPVLNGAMWTIAYEFRCYLLIIILGLLGLLTRRRPMLALTIVFVVANVTASVSGFNELIDSFSARHHGAGWLIGIPSQSIRLTSAFLVGTCFFVWREALLSWITGRIALFAILVTAALMFHRATAETALITIGALALFWLAMKARLGMLQSINDKWDISYGTYLYGWPIATLFLWFHIASSPLALATVTLPLSLLCGAISWWGVEKWTKDIKRSRSASTKKR